MPISCSIDEAKEVVYAVAVGVVSDAELLPPFRAVFSDPRFRADMRHLSDWTAMTQDNVSSATLVQLAKMTRFSPKSRRAILVARDLEFGLFRVFESYVSLHSATQLQVFRDRQAALNWLNQDQPEEKHIQ